MKETDAPISQVRFEALLAAYGARPERWPDRERNAAIELLGSSVPGRVLAREQHALDAWLSVASAPTVPTELLQRLNAIPEKRGSPLLARRLRGRVLWVPALGWAVAAVLGLWLGARFTHTDRTAARSEGDEKSSVQDENERLAISGSTLDGSEVP